MAQQSVITNRGISNARYGETSSLWSRMRRAFGANAQDRIATVDRVTLADGSSIVVARASLAAAKDLLAAQRAAERRMLAHAENESARMAQRRSA